MEAGWMFLTVDGKTYAGYVSECEMGGATFFAVAVPDAKGDLVVCQYISPRSVSKIEVMPQRMIDVMYRLHPVESNLMS